jgi:FKBP-type peptidyl-prolyl cis-trans isomerase 2
MEETKNNKKVVYIMIIVAVALFAYIAYAVMQSNKNKNMENTDTTMTTGSRVAEAGDIIVINYSGKLENGTEFDSSYKRGQPLVFQVGLGQVIVGWDEGLIGVTKGDKKTLTIPADKGYGDQEIKDPQTGKVVIPANSTLIFDVEVVEVISKADAERMVAEQQAAMSAADQGTGTAQ